VLGVADDQDFLAVALTGHEIEAVDRGSAVDGVLVSRGE
jgi:hypothetical protein